VFGDFDEDLARPAVREEPHGDVALLATDLELMRERLPRILEALAGGTN
jgi:hypothetical protein